MVPTTERPASTGWREETRNVEVPGMLDTDGAPFVVTLRRLPASEVYLTWEEGAQQAAVRETWRRWAQQCVVAPRFSFNGTRDGVVWDDLPLVAHAALGRLIAAYSFEVNDEAKLLEAAFRGGEPAGATAGGASGGPSGDGLVAPGTSTTQAAVDAAIAAGGGSGI